MKGFENRKVIWRVKDVIHEDIRFHRLYPDKVDEFIEWHIKHYISRKDLNNGKPTQIFITLWNELEQL